MSTITDSSRDREAILRDKIKNLPQAPGVYFFYAADKQLLYIGKATNLRSRVQSYFRGVIPSEANPTKRGLAQSRNLGSDLSTSSSADEYAQDDTKKIVSVQGRSEWIGRMVSQVEDIAYEQTDSVLEALILESNLIKKHQPKYNTLEKDDKSFAYFVITKEEFPRVLILRKTDLDKISNKIQNQKSKFKHKDVAANNIYGPYTSKHQMQIALKIIRRIFPFHSLKQKSEKGCLDFQLGVCPGPYSGSISSEDYKKNIRGIKMILEGKKKRLIGTLEKEMNSAAKKHEFEKAADLRNKMFALSHINDVALLTRDFSGDESRIMNRESGIRIEAYDISNIAGQHAVGSMVVFENEKPNKSEYRKFKIKTVQGSDDVGMMKEMLSRRFRNDWPMPYLILLDGGQGHFNMGRELILNLGLAVGLAAVAKGADRKNQELRIMNQENLNSDVLQLLQNQHFLKNIMDEAHRFAITFHRHRRKKGMLE